MEDDKLIELIDKYYQGDTILEEEVYLRRCLGTTVSDNPEIREAQAIMSYVAMAASKEGKKRTVWYRWTEAAVIAIVLAVGLSSLIWNDNLSLCSTMIACKEYDNNETALALISSQLDAIGEASDELEEELREDLLMVVELPDSSE